MRTDLRQFHAKLNSAVLVALVASAAVLGLTGCGAEAPEVDDPTAKLPKVSTEGFEAVSAELDFALGTASTPISPYLVNQDFETARLFAQARETLITECMGEAGFAYEGLTGVDWAALRPQEDRLFGLWDRNAAAQFGTEFDPTRGVPKGTLVEEGPDFNSALNVCAEQAMQHETLGPLAMKLSEQTLADRIRGNASDLALHSPAGKDVDEAFASCLAGKSIVVDPSSGYPSAEYSDLGKEAEIEAALAEVDCNLDTGRIETLYTLRAQYESAYMQKYESQLAAVLKDKQSDYAQLQAITERTQ